MFLNVVGGVRIGETSADLPVLVATVSSMTEVPVRRDTLIFGEVGLAGEIRPVAYGEERLKEAAKLGFRYAIIPAGNRPKHGIDGLEIIPVDLLREALKAVEALPAAVD